MSRSNQFNKFVLYRICSKGNSNNFVHNKDTRVSLVNHRNGHLNIFVCMTKCSTNLG